MTTMSVRRAWRRGATGARVRRRAAATNSALVIAAIGKKSRSRSRSRGRRRRQCCRWRCDVRTDDREATRICEIYELRVVADGGGGTGWRLQKRKLPRARARDSPNKRFGGRTRKMYESSTGLVYLRRCRCR